MRRIEMTRNLKTWLAPNQICALKLFLPGQWLKSFYAGRAGSRHRTWAFCLWRVSKGVDERLRLGRKKNHFGSTSHLQPPSSFSWIQRQTDCLLYLYSAIINHLLPGAVQADKGSAFTYSLGRRVLWGIRSCGQGSSCQIGRTFGNTRFL